MPQFGPQQVWGPVSFAPYVPRISFVPREWEAQYYHDSMGVRVKSKLDQRSLLIKSYLDTKRACG